jgi:hypothetical protein
MTIVGQASAIAWSFARSFPPDFMRATSLSIGSLAGKPAVAGRDHSAARASSRWPGSVGFENAMSRRRQVCR